MEAKVELRSPMIALGIALCLVGCGPTAEPHAKLDAAPSISMEEASKLRQQDDPQPSPTGDQIPVPAPLPSTAQRSDSSMQSPPPTAPKRRVNPRRLYQLDELETVTVKIGKHEFETWIMDTDSKRAEGMMFLENEDFKETEAMVFVYSEPNTMSFWMKNTLVDLDIAFIDRNRNIIHTTTMYRLDETPVPSRGKALWAIEFKAGALKKFGIRPGQKVEFSKPVKSKD